MSPGSGVFHLGGLEEATSLLKALVSLSLAQGALSWVCWAVVGRSWSHTQGTWDTGKGVRSIKLLSEVNHIRSPGDEAKYFFAFPNKSSAGASWENMKMHCSFAFKWDCSSPANCFSWAPLPGWAKGKFWEEIRGWEKPGYPPHCLHPRVVCLNEGGVGWSTSFFQHWLPSFVSLAPKEPLVSAMIQTTPRQYHSASPVAQTREESACNAGDLSSIPGLGMAPGRRHGNSLQYSCLENPHGQRNLVGYSPWGCKESDITEHLSTAHKVSSPSPLGPSAPALIGLPHHLLFDFLALPSPM